MSAAPKEPMIPAVSYPHLDVYKRQEVKYAKEMKELDAACEAAITQIKDKRYDEALRDEELSLIHIFICENIYFVFSMFWN